MSGGGSRAADRAGDRPARPGAPAGRAGGTAGLGAVGWTVGVACAVTMATALARGLAPGERLGPASSVTLARATAAVGVAALAADSLAHDTPVALLVALAAVALALDAADGWVARRTGTATALGARFDGEVDAFLIAALSVYAAPDLRRVGARDRGGALRVPRRRVAAAVDARAAAAAPLAPGGRGDAGDRVDGRGRRGAAPGAHLGAAGRRARRARGVGRRVHVVAVAPPGRRPRAPGETRVPRGHRRGALGARPAARLGRARRAEPPGPAHRRRVRPAPARAARRRRRGRPRARRPAPRAGRGRGCGAERARAREGPRHRVLHGVRPAVQARRRLGLPGIGIETLRDAIGSGATLVVAVALALLVALLALPVLALLRVTRVAAGHRGWTLRAAAVLGVVWVVLRVAGAPVASSSAAALAVDEVQAVRAGLQDRAALARELAHDRFAATPGDRLLTALRGKDVLLVFVESYGRVAVQGSSFSPGVRAVLERGDAQLRSAGFSSRSAFLTSPTFGGLSWLAHSTLQSGIRVDGQRRYDQLVQHDRLTLTSAFERAGWRAVGVMPANHRAWPEGFSYYRYDAIYDRRNLGYRGPDFGLPPMPDQYALQALQRRELAPRHRAPLFAEVDLDLEPRAVDAHPAADPVGRRRRRVRLRPRPGGGVHAGRALRRRRAGARRLRALDRVLAEHALLVRAALRRRRPRARRARRPPARDARHGPGRRPRRADLGDRPRPEGDATGSPDGGGRTACCRARTRRSGRWPRSATASSPRSRRGHEAGRPRAVRPGPRSARACRRTPPASSPGRRAS